MAIFGSLFLGSMRCFIEEHPFYKAYAEVLARKGKYTGDNFVNMKIFISSLKVIEKSCSKNEGANNHSNGYTS